MDKWLVEKLVPLLVGRVGMLLSGALIGALVQAGVLGPECAARLGELPPVL